MVRISAGVRRGPGRCAGFLDVFEEDGQLVVRANECVGVYAGREDMVDYQRNTGVRIRG